MKRAFCLVALSLTVALGAQTTTLRVAYEDKEQPPYYLGLGSAVPKDKPGICVEMVKMLETRLPGLTVHFTRLPWARCTSDLGNDKVDAIFNSSYTVDRLPLGWYPTTDKTHAGPVDPTKRIATISYHLYTMKSSALAWDGTKFSDPKAALGAQAGYTMVTDLKKMGMQVVEAPAAANALGMLVAGRFPGAVLQEVTADAIIAADPGKFAGVAKSPLPVASKHYYLMLSKEFVALHPELAQTVWKTLGDIRNSEFARLSARYAE